jgi:DtxR family Mn-dependent transcriptional regulator
VLGLDWAKSDAEAHRLEHAMSDEVAELLNKHLGSPTTCPHGNPIPGNVRSVAPDAKMFQLNKANEGDRVIVMRISEYAENVSELLDYLGKRGMMPGATLTISEIAPLNGPITFKIGNKTVSMSREVAGYVWVKRE